MSKDIKRMDRGAKVFATQLAWWSLPMPEFQGSNPLIGNFIEHLFLLGVK